MRYLPQTAFFAFLLLSFVSPTFGQGRMHIIPYRYAWVIEKPDEDCNLLFKNAARLDSLKAAEAAKFVIDTVNGWKDWALVENNTFGKNRGDLKMIADVNALHPYFRDKVLELVEKCKAKGIELAFVETYRTHAKQNEYKGMGKKYTRSGGGKSKHQYGLAVDVVPVVKGEAQWDNLALWRKIGVIGERLGLRWGGRWRHPFDPGHFEWTGGLNSVSLSAGYKPHIPKEKELYPCLEEDLMLLRKYWKEWETHQAAERAPARN
ncbi:MAG TPA: M15 family metallopeptidase [Cyclobacteriaceae bacterium]|nr:M15 family metallopeptidase [Cyclobacteriaceae bacterium]